MRDDLAAAILVGMKAFLVVAVLLAGLFVYRAFVPEPAPAARAAYVPPFPDGDSVVEARCQGELLKRQEVFATVESGAVLAPEGEAYRLYTATLELTGANGVSRLETWACRYGADKKIKVERIKPS